MAQLSAQPRQTTSVALSVRLGSFLKKSRIVVSSAGTRDDPPTTSTDAMSSREIFACSNACAHRRPHAHIKDGGLIAASALHRMPAAHMYVAAFDLCWWCHQLALAKHVLLLNQSAAKIAQCISISAIHPQSMYRVWRAGDA